MDRADPITEREELAPEEENWGTLCQVARDLTVCYDRKVPGSLDP